MREDRAYLERTAVEMRERHGLTVSSVLALGRSAARDPPAVDEESQCDLIAMTTHGHRLIGDILFGSTIDYVRHRSQDPAPDRQPQDVVGARDSRLLATAIAASAIARHSGENSQVSQERNGSSPSDLKKPT